jgi:hypothetical protein
MFKIVGERLYSFSYLKSAHLKFTHLHIRTSAYLKSINSYSKSTSAHHN